MKEKVTTAPKRKASSLPRLGFFQKKNSMSLCYTPPRKRASYNPFSRKLRSMRGTKPEKLKMTKNLESFKTVLRHLEVRSHMLRENPDSRGASYEEKIKMSIMYEAEEAGVIEAAMYILSRKEYDILRDFERKLDIVEIPHFSRNV